MGPFYDMVSVPSTNADQRIVADLAARACFPQRFTMKRWRRTGATYTNF